MGSSLRERSDAAPASRSELKTRTVSAVVLGAVALGATAIGGWPFALLWLAAGAVLSAEWLAMTGSQPRRGLLVIAVAGLAALLVIHALSGSPASAAVVFGVALAATLGLARSSRDRLWATAGLGYACTVALVPVLVRERPDLGLWAVLWMFAVVWATDVAAYFTGRAVGGPKLWARVSPKKTWSGFSGGLTAGTACGALVAGLAARSGSVLPASFAALTVAAALASAASQVGDLAESAMKRAFAVKDSGRLIPGHGGVMDRLDGFAAVACLVGLALAGARLAAPSTGVAP